MTLATDDRRDAGKVFDVKTTDGRSFTQELFKVCRGCASIAPPGTLREQDYHWLLAFYATEVPDVGLTDDDARWPVLW